jgi:polo-like kinase 1
MKMKTYNGEHGQGRAPLRQRQQNVDNVVPSSRGSSKGGSSKVSSKSSRQSDENVEIEELRRRPDGEGHTVHRYIRGKMLGKGGFAKVYMCTSLDTNRQYAVKIVPKANLVKTRARQKVCYEV